jgi:hypothetical protein
MKRGCVTAALLLCACGGSSSPAKSGDGTITITSPANNATVTADANSPDVNISFTVANFTLKAPGSCKGMSNCGHVHLTVDGTACNDPSAPGAYNNDGFASPISVGLDYCAAISGTHVVEAQLHNDDHSTYSDPAGTPVVSDITITAP